MKITSFLEKNNNNLDLIRAILAGLVIFGHTPILNGSSFLWVDPIEKLFSYTYSGALAVKMFFFISGMVVTNSLLKNRSIIKFFVSRFFRIIPGLLFLLLLTSFVVGPLVTRKSLSSYFYDVETYRYVWQNLLFHTNYSLPGVFKANIYPEAVNGSLWSLYYEIGCYLFLISVVMITAGHKGLLNTVIALIVVDTIFPEKIFLHWLGDNPDIVLLPFCFSFGAFIAVNADKLEINHHTELGFFLLLFVFRNTPVEHLILIIASGILILLISSNEQFKKLKPKYDISYGIYLWGFLVQQLTYNYLGHIYAGFHFFISLIVSIILGYVSFCFIELPFMKIGASFYSNLSNRLLAKSIE